MAEKTFLTPEVLPVLPVRDTVLFPGAMLPLTVGRESSLALVGSLQGEEKLLGVVAQLDPRIEDPAAADLHKVGTLARVHKTVKMPNGNVVVFLEGLQRIQIVELVNLRKDNKVAILFSADSANALSYMPVSDHVNYMTLLRQMYDALYELNVEPDFVQAGDSNLPRYKVLLVPPLYSASDEHRGPRRARGLHRRNAALAFHALAPGAD